MTIIAGAFSLSPQYPIKYSLRHMIDSLISRQPGKKTNSFWNDRLYIASLDLNAFGDPAFHVNARGSATAVAGEPLIAPLQGGSFSTRFDDVRLLQSELDASRLHVLRQAAGIFCAVHYDAVRRSLFLISDKLALRPFYYCLTDKYIYFASALRILESLDTVSKHMDLRGVTEISAFGFPLADRTPYCEIKMLEPGQVLSISEEGTRFIRYWQWDKIRPWEGSDEELAEEAHTRFLAAVKRRLRDDTSVVSFLSGGLDSRVIVAVLRHMGISVHTFAFGLPGTQDLYFASRFAEAAGTIHEEMAPTAGPDSQWAKMLTDAWEAAGTRSEEPPERPHAAWSGDGGSVVLGRVYLLKRMVDLLKTGKRGDAINLYIEQFGSKVLKRLIKEKFYREIADVPVHGVNEELDRIECEDPVRQFYLFLVLNDQRHHLRDHYENIDLHCLELHQPFFDSDFMETVMSGPVETGLYHNFYMMWLKYFPPVVTAVPWQAYPGHQPCPLSVPQDLGYQWGGQAALRNERTHKGYYLQQARRMLSAPDFPEEIVGRQPLRIAALIHGLGLRDYGYVIKTADVYHRYWKHAEGRPTGG